MKRLKKHFLTIMATLYLSGCGMNSVYITDCDAKGLRTPALPPSAAVNNNVMYSLHRAEYTKIGDLAGMNMEAEDRQIEITVEGRILAFAQVKISNPGGVAIRGACRVLIGKGEARDEDMSSISGSAIWHTTESSAYHITVPIVAHALKPAGTYNVVVECEQLAAEGQTRAALSNLIVWQAGNHEI